MYQYQTNKSESNTNPPKFHLSWEISHGIIMIQVFNLSSDRLQLICGITCPEFIKSREGQILTASITVTIEVGQRILLPFIYWAQKRSMGTIYLLHSDDRGYLQLYQDVIMLPQIVLTELEKGTGLVPLLRDQSFADGKLQRIPIASYPELAPLAWIRIMGQYLHKPFHPVVGKNLMWWSQDPLVVVEYQAPEILIWDYQAHDWESIIQECKTQANMPYHDPLSNGIELGNMVTKLRDCIELQQEGRFARKLWFRIEQLLAYQHCPIPPIRQYFEIESLSQLREPDLVQIETALNQIDLNLSHL